VACAEVPSDQSRSGRIPLARRRRTSHRRIVSVWDRRFEVPRTSRFLRQGGGAGESAQAILCHDRRPRSPAFDGIAPPAAVLLDETGIGGGEFLCGIGALGLTNTSTAPFDHAPSKPKPSLRQRFRNRASLGRPFSRDEWQAASQTSSHAAARSTPAR
jgi:hypothetical protein